MTHDAHGCEAFLGPGFDLIFLAVGTVSRAYGRRNCAIAGLSSRLRKAGARACPGKAVTRVCII